MTHVEIRRLGRVILLRAGWGDQHIGTVLPHWIDGYKRGVRSVSKRKGKKR